MDFGKRLKTLREKLNLTRDELADKINISYSAVSKYETNSRFPDQEMLKKIADYFNVSIDYLLCRTDIENIEYSKIGGTDFHSFDVHGLPNEAIKEVEKYIELLKLKYYKGNNFKD
ncbi:helix-turn-helix domain-containing protein [Wukongibacter sp. M2B1]|uniref:helix-turn-helix domain-containing protein n=1 Tax=Wukongibacter sp. M2B1 TaxID=3088895 RepID=UPI003D7BF03D